MFQFTQSVQLMADPGERVEDLLPAKVSNARIAEVLFNIATILEMQQANPYRIAAYRNAARGILALGEPVAPILARGGLPPVPGLGERLRKKISELVMTGHMTFYDDLCEDPRYRSQWVDRVARMAVRDRHHPSVVLWSLGNESGYGANHDAAAGWLRRFDPSRPLHYEGAMKYDWGSPQTASDIPCPMYPPISAIIGHATAGTQRHPLILCEFSHAMGNSNGTLGEYWDAIESTPGLQGGSVWERWDHGLLQTLPKPRVGQVINPSEIVAEIVPSAEKLVFDARLSPRDIGFVEKGQPAKVKVDA